MCGCHVRQPFWKDFQFSNVVFHYRTILPRIINPVQIIESCLWFGNFLGKSVLNSFVFLWCHVYRHRCQFYDEE
jgi:hypothetical protein